MSGQFSVAALIYDVNARRGVVQTNSGNQMDYGDILAKIQHTISEKHSGELAQTLYSDAAEALTVQEAGRTGHTIVSTLHANSARAAYDRILTMCLQAGTKLSEERLLKNIVEAFPIMVFKMRLPDGSRKYVEIFEATGVKDGELLGNTLYQYRVSRHDRDSSGSITKTHDRHIRMGAISEHLTEQLSLCGVDASQLKPLMRKPGVSL
ncbi:hypothetical protein FACS1894208_05190 [Clostridia bacterium]|nr:hypothetical protein FACS1894208_05190 [Clostridia bacterium]